MLDTYIEPDIAREALWIDQHHIAPPGQDESFILPGLELLVDCFARRAQHGAEAALRHMGFDAQPIFRFGSAGFAQIDQRFGEPPGQI